ncbi:MAG: hypothetical protein UHU19_03710 [Lachnospiraceae bacterium]|nr:hypothetical protein [Lachnospiraceae bacterium]
MDFQPNYSQTPNTSEQGSASMAFASLAFGIVSIITSCFGTSLIFGSLGLILALLSRGGSNAFPKNTIVGLTLNIIGVVIGCMLLLSSLILIVSFGGIENFMNTMQQYMDAYYSALDTIPMILP